MRLVSSCFGLQLLRTFGETSQGTDCVCVLPNGQEVAAANIVQGRRQTKEHSGNGTQDAYVSIAPLDILMSQSATSLSQRPAQLQAADKAAFGEALKNQYGLTVPVVCCVNPEKAPGASLSVVVESEAGQAFRGDLLDSPSSVTPISKPGYQHMHSIALLSCAHLCPAKPMDDEVQQREIACMGSCTQALQSSCSCPISCPGMQRAADTNVVLRQPTGKPSWTTSFLNSIQYSQYLVAASSSTSEGSLLALFEQGGSLSAAGSPHIFEQKPLTPPSLDRNVLETSVLFNLAEALGGHAAAHANTHKADHWGTHTTAFGRSFTHDAVGADASLDLTSGAAWEHTSLGTIINFGETSSFLSQGSNLISPVGTVSPSTTLELLRHMQTCTDATPHVSIHRQTGSISALALAERDCKLHAAAAPTAAAFGPCPNAALTLLLRLGWPEGKIPACNCKGELAACGSGPLPASCTETSASATAQENTLAQDWLPHAGYQAAERSAQPPSVSSVQPQSRPQGRYDHAWVCKNAPYDMSLVLAILTEDSLELLLEP